jgi:endoglucanase
LTKLPRLFSLIKKNIIFVKIKLFIMNRLLLITALIFGFNTFGQTPNFPFPTPVTYTAGTIKPNNFTQTQLNNQVKAYYDLWKGTYIKQHCTDASSYYIDFSNSSSGDTAICVSEGQGYGMVIVAYMAGHDPNAKVIFDGLYKWAKTFPSNINNLLMKWRQKEGCLADSNDSATDGDLNIAYALLLADKQWGSTGTINYLQDAKNIINNGIKSGLITPFNSVKLGDWANSGNANFFNATRLSDYNSNHFRAFKNVTSDAVWDDVVTKGYDIINTIQTNNSPNTGLLPDFTVNVNTTPAPSNGQLLEDADDGSYDYNACRMPWNLGLDYVLNGEAKAKTAANKINNWIKNKAVNNVENIESGYRLNGDGYGKNYRDLSFIAPFAVGAMVDSSHQQWLNNLWSFIVSKDLSFNSYFAHIIKMQSMIIISGNYWKPQDVLGIEENSFVENSISSFPNPTNRNLTLKFNLKENANVDVSISDVLGKLVFSKSYNQLSSGQNTINLEVEKYEKGIYYCQITSGKTKKVNKIIIQ